VVGNEKRDGKSVTSCRIRNSLHPLDAEPIASAAFKAGADCEQMIGAISTDDGDAEKAVEVESSKSCHASAGPHLRLLTEIAELEVATQRRWA
jgi:hypothetical protein